MTFIPTFDEVAEIWREKLYPHYSEGEFKYALAHFDTWAPIKQQINLARSIAVRLAYDNLSAR